MAVRSHVQQAYPRKQQPETAHMTELEEFDDEFCIFKDGQIPIARSRPKSKRARLKSNNTNAAKKSKLENMKHYEEIIDQKNERYTELLTIAQEMANDLDHYVCDDKETPKSLLKFNAFKERGNG